MNVLSTPRERFEGLPDYPFLPHFATIRDETIGPLKMHYVDEGPRQAEVILLLHGEPTWSYLYRHMITSLSKQYRVVAPDFIGFGKSDKLTDRTAYTYERHISWTRQCLDAIGLQDITLFCQDWGGLIGLRLLTAEPTRFQRVVAANTFLPTGEWPVGEAFLKWREFSQNSPVFPIGKVVQKASVRPLTADVEKAYDAPFPDETYKAGARAFPLLVPVDKDDAEAIQNREAWNVLREWERPFLTAFSDQDAITRGGEKVFEKLVPGCRNQEHVVVKGAGHFLQEDASAELVEIINRFIAAHPKK